MSIIQNIAHYTQIIVQLIKADFHLMVYILVQLDPQEKLKFGVLTKNKSINLHFVNR